MFKLLKYLRKIDILLFVVVLVLLVGQVMLDLMLPDYMSRIINMLTDKSTIVIKDISTGASNDIQRASDIARKMVTEWGMSDEIGNFFLGGSHEVFIGRDYQAQHTYSEEIAAKIDVEIKKILDECYAKAIKILTENRSVLDNMVRVLFEKETIYTAEVDALIKGASASEVIAMESIQDKVSPIIITEKEAAEKKEASSQDVTDKPCDTNSVDNQND